MRLHYYPESDSLYVECKTRPRAEAIEVTEGLNVDIDADVDVVGFDEASRRLDLTRWKPRRCPSAVKAG